MSGTMTRLGAAAVGLSVLVPALVWGGSTAVIAILLAAGGWATWEYSRMAFPFDAAEAWPWVVAGSALLGAHGLYGDPEVTTGLLAMWLVAVLIRCTLAPGEALDRAADRMGRFVLGTAWIGGLLPFLLRLRQLDDGVQGVWWVVLALAISWMGDTGAYFAGRAFGRTKLSPRISPKKTWEGYWGGVVTVTASVAVIAWLGLPQLGAGSVIFLGLVGSSVGVLGDLAESLLKRAYGVKDSGGIMPGHGGLLDRIDSVLFVAPVVYTYVVWAGVA